MNKTSDRPTIRLNRFLAMLGVGSRRACDDIILAGRVVVDGRRVKEPGIQVVPGITRVSLDKSPLSNPPRRMVLLLNKPAGVMSTVSDPEGRPTVLDFCKRYARKRRLFPVGRLDFNSTGLILLTNDGSLCYRLTHPRFEIPRTYQVRVRGFMSPRKLARLTRMALESVRVKKPREPVAILKRGERESVLKITLHEGKNRQVRRMCETVGLRVVRLRRVGYGPISIRKLPLGSVRPLEPKELQSLERVLAKG